MLLLLLPLILLLPERFSFRLRRDDEAKSPYSWVGSDEASVAAWERSTSVVNQTWKYSRHK